MGRGRLLLVLVVVLGLLGVPVAAGAGPGSEPVYDVVDLGLGKALAVNARGEVVGQVLGESVPGHAFVWQADRGMTELHAAADWPADQWSNAYGINRHGEIVAQLSGAAVPPSPPDSQTLYVDWDRRTGAVEAMWITAELSPGDINDRGVVVGGEMGGAYLWTVKDGRVPLVDDGVANAVRVNNHGQILGATSSAFVPGWPNGLHYIIRERDGSLRQVAFFEMGPPPNPMPELGGINNRGQVVYTHRPDTSITVIGRLWDPSAGLAEYEGFAFEAINDHGLIAGWTRSNGTMIPVVMDDDGIAVQLPAPDGWSGRGSVLDINNRGVAVGWLAGPDGQHAVVWVPSK